MTKVLLRAAPETFFTPFAGCRKITLPIHLGWHKMTGAPRPNGCRLSASFNGGQRKITVRAKSRRKSRRYYDGYEAGVLPDDLFEEYGEYNRSVNVWWDAGRCPPPLNFDVSKIGITVIDAVRHINTSRPIYLRVYGNLGELFPKMANDTVRIFSESGFKLAGFEVKDEDSNVSDFLFSCQQRRKRFSNVMEENLMIDDLIDCALGEGVPPTPIHMVVLDAKGITASAMDQLNDGLRHKCCFICVEPERESLDGKWRWKPLWPAVAVSNDSGNSLDEGALSDDDYY